MIRIPYTNMYGVKLGDVNLSEYPFKKHGEVLLKVNKAGRPQYLVEKTDFPECFQAGQGFSSTTYLFYDVFNPNIHSKLSKELTDEFKRICFTIEDRYYCVFSKHKVDEDHWKMIIYSAEDEVLYKEVCNFLNWSKQKPKGYYRFNYE